VANTGSNTVSILLGNGDGTFQTAQNYAVDSGPISVASGDFNADGFPDLVVANSWSNTVSLLLGNGDGTFQAAVNYTVGSNPSFVAVGDFNGDGHLDLVVANAGTVPQWGDTVSILLGNGDGTFQAAQTYAVGKGPVSVAVGDFNGDGISDIAVANNLSNSVSILRGRGDGTFESAYTFGASSGPISVAVGDFNGDGKQDIVITNFHVTVPRPRGFPYVDESDVRVFLGNGDGTFEAAGGKYAVGICPDSVAVADLNGDGIPDLIVANGERSGFGDSRVSILLGNGDGTFQASQAYGAGGSPYSVAVGDFNGDGYPDLALANHVPPGTVTVLLNDAHWGP
jgi:hypothetical protein